MNRTLYFYIAVVIRALITFMTRSLPFALFSGKKELPEIITYLGKYLPGCIMMIIIVYCIRGISFSSPAGFMPELISILTVILIHLWKRKDLLSIAAGTFVYMFLVQFVFI